MKKADADASAFFMRFMYQSKASWLSKTSEMEP